MLEHDGTEHVLDQNGSSCDEQDEEIQVGRSQKQEISFNDTLQRPAFFNKSPPPNFHYVPLVILNYGPISLLIHWVGKSLNDTITSQ